MSGAFTIAHLDQMEHPWPKWILCRRSLGLESFGMNVAELQPGEAIPEHDEVARDQEEVFVTLVGNATLVIDGVDHPAPVGTFVRLDPQVPRFVRNDSDELTRVLIVSAPRASGFQPMDWA